MKSLEKWNDKRTHSAILVFNGYEVQIFTSELDGKTVIQIDGPDESEGSDLMSEHGQPVLRVNLNDARLWEGYKDGHEETGD